MSRLNTPYIEQDYERDLKIVRTAPDLLEGGVHSRVGERILFLKNLGLADLVVKGSKKMPLNQCDEKRLFFVVNDRYNGACRRLAKVRFGEVKIYGIGEQLDWVDDLMNPKNYYDLERERNNELSELSVA